VWKNSPEQVHVLFHFPMETTHVFVCIRLGGAAMCFYLGMGRLVV
jgi:hypothetical protein